MRRAGRPRRGRTVSRGVWMRAARCSTSTRRSSRGTTPTGRSGSTGRVSRRATRRITASTRGAVRRPAATSRRGTDRSVTVRELPTVREDSDRESIHLALDLEIADFLSVSAAKCDDDPKLALKLCPAQTTVPTASIHFATQSDRWRPAESLDSVSIRWFARISVQIGRASCRERVLVQV